MLNFHQVRRRPILSSAAAITAAAAVFATGCHRDRPPAPTPAPAAASAPARPAPARADPAAAIVLADSRAALVPVPIPTGPAWPASVALQLGGEPPQPTPLWWLAPAPAPPPPDPAQPPRPADRMQHWLGERLAWTASPAGPTTGAAGLALVAVPAQAGLAGPSLRVNAAPIAVRWLAPASGAFDFASPHAAPTTGPWLAAANELAKTQPWVSWRAALADPQPARAANAPAGADSLAARLADQHAGVWTVALQRLARADRDTARRLAIRLGGLVDFGGGVAAPVYLAWPGPRQAGDGLDLLLADLLADDLSDPERAERARAWIASLPAGAAWVLDDAGLRDNALGLATIIMLNLTDAPAAASVTIDSAAAPVEMLTLRPMSAAAVRIPVRPPDPPRAEPVPRRLTLRVGPWRGQATILGDPVPARPPGIRIGPLQRDVAMPAVLACAETGQMPLVTPEPDGLTLGMLLRSATDSAAASRSRANSWTVYLECQRPPAAAETPGRDEVRIEFGPSGAPTAVWRIDAAGRSTLDGRPADSAADVTHLAEPDRWLVWAPVPAAAVEPDGRIRVSVVRERTLPDGTLERTAWPRAMLPWQTDPGRITVDLTAWDPSASPR